MGMYFSHFTSLVTRNSLYHHNYSCTIPCTLMLAYLDNISFKYSSLFKIRYLLEQNIILLIYFIALIEFCLLIYPEKKCFILGFPISTQCIFIAFSLPQFLLGILPLLPTQLHVLSVNKKQNENKNFKWKTNIKKHQDHFVLANYFWAGSMSCCMVDMSNNTQLKKTDFHFASRYK